MLVSALLTFFAAASAASATALVNHLDIAGPKLLRNRPVSSPLWSYIEPGLVKNFLSSNLTVTLLSKVPRNNREFSRDSDPAEQNCGQGF